MKKRILSVILTVIMLLSVMPTAFAAEPKVALSVTAGVSSPSQNEEVTFTLYIQTLTGGSVSGFDLTIDVPTGLTYVTNSGTIDSGFKTATGAENFEWIEADKKFFCSSSALEGLIGLSTKRAIGTFKCTVDDDASGSYSVGITTTSLDDKGVSPIPVGEQQNTKASITIAKAPLTAASATVDVPAKGTALDTIVDIGGATTYAAEVAWYEGGAVSGTAVTGSAKPDQIYTAQITLKPATGESFAASVTMSGTVTGAQAPNASGWIVVTKTFPATAGADALGGSVSITGDTTVESVLTANTGSLNYGTESAGTLSYQWKRGTAIIGTNSATYTTVAADVGKSITVIVSNSNNTGSVTSAAFGPIVKKAAPTAPAAPALTKTATTVSVTSPVSGQEYAIVKGTAAAPTSGWDATGSFTGLDANTAYRVYTRVKETGTTMAGATTYADATTDKLTQTISGLATTTLAFNGTLDLSTLFSSNATSATLTYSVGTALSGTTLSGSTVTAGTTAGSFVVNVNSAAVGDYAAAVQKAIAITVSAKTAQAFEAGFTTAVGKTYGDAAYTKAASLTTGNGAITYVSSDTSVATVTNSGTVTILKNGTTTITATAAETATYAQTTASYTLTVAQRTVSIVWANNTGRVYGDGKAVTATIGNKVGSDDVSLNVTNGDQTTAGGPYTAAAALTGAKASCYKLPATATTTYSISKATLTGTPVYTKITTSGKTLADAALAKNTGWPAGTIKWVDTSNNELPGTTVVAANTSYKWQFVPTDTTNYNSPLTGSITLYSVSTGGGGVSSYTLTFNVNGGSAISAVSKTSGTTVDLTAYKPTRTGYTFDGWYSDAKLTTKVTSVKLTANTTVYAKWTAASDLSFTDVPSDAYYKDAVKWAVDEGITEGTSATTFNPNGICNRAQAVTFLWRASDSPEPTATSCPFTDVSKDAYYYKAVLWAVEKGITKGTGATTFGPTEDCSRAQIVTFQYRTALSPATGTVNPFTDVANDAYYASAVLWAVKEGITQGTSTTTFGPNADCTRAQIVTFLFRQFGK